MSWGKPSGKRDSSWKSPQSAMKRQKVGEQFVESAFDDNDEFDDSLELTQADLAEMDVIVSQATQADIPQKNIDDQEIDNLFLAPQSRQTLGNFSQSRHQGFGTSRTNNNNFKSPIPRTSDSGEMQKVQSELQKTKEDKYRSDGEVRILRQKMLKLEEDMEKVRQQRDDLADIQKRERSEKEKQLQQQVDSLQSQTQFKDREIQEHLEKVKKLQQQQDQQDNRSVVNSSPKPPSPRKIPVKPSPPSRAMQKRLKTGDESFPTSFSFMQQGKTTKPPTLEQQISKPVMTCVSCQTERKSGCDQAKTGQTQGRLKRLKLNISNKINRGQDLVGGTEVVQRLLHTSCNSGIAEGSNLDHFNTGLTGLLHTMSTSLTLANLTYTRGRDQSMLSPVKPKRQNVSWSTGSSGDGTHQVVTRQHFTLAIEGLMLLLEGSSDYRNKLLGHFIKEGFMESPKDFKESSDESKVLKLPKQANHLAAIYLFPLLTDYLQHYLDLIQFGGGGGSRGAGQTQGAPTPTTPSTSMSKSLHTSIDTPGWASGTTVSSVSSYESSLDSLSSCVQQLLLKGKVYASSMESFAVAALRTLSLLITLCPSVVELLIKSISKEKIKKKTSDTTTTNNTSSASTSTEIKNSIAKKTGSGSDADDEKSLSSTEVQILSGPLGTAQLDSLTSCKTWSERCSMLLNLVFLLASQDLEDHTVSTTVVEYSLRTLVQLCQICGKQQLEHLDVILTHDILAICLKNPKFRGVTMWAQRLLSSMAVSETLLLQMCTKSETCPLFLMHGLCLRRNSDKNYDTICVFIHHIECVSDIIFHQRNNCSRLLSNCCQCSSELVRSVIIAMDRLFSFYQDVEKIKTVMPDRLLFVLGRGVTLIHMLVQENYPKFRQHHILVQKQYVRTLSGLLKEMRKNSDQWEMHLSALEELCDFDPDSGTLSQDSEHEDDPKMDQT